MKDDFFMNSMCLNEYLHRFKIVKEFPNGVLEVCQICGMDKFFTIIEGKIDNQDYMSYHARQALFRKHPYFHHEYEYNPLQDNIKSPYAA